jgi:hypothetical protein
MTYGSGQAGAALLLLLAACSGSQETETGEDEAAPPSAIADPPAAAPAVAPPPVATAKPGEAQGAADTLRHYFALIEERRFEEAWRLREPGDKLPSAEAFAAYFSSFAEHRAQIGVASPNARAEGAEYVEVPVQTYARLASGPPLSSAGTITLRRTGGGPWRIYTSP